MASLELDQVTKVYGRDVAAVREVSLLVEDGEMVTLVGPSGCGKSTILRLVAGLEDLTSGEVRIDGKAVTHLAPGRRDVAMVFQQAAVFPHLTVAENIGFGLRVRRRSSSEIARRVAEVAALLRLDDLLDRRPDQLSGGQSQRVAIGRALLRDPLVSLMDEPLSSLDARLRGQMRTEIGRLQRGSGTTTVYVTHDQAEAVTLGDRVAVMRDGRIEQVDGPREVYRRPATAFVAGFIGTPAMNLVHAKLDDGCVSIGDAVVRCGSGPWHDLRDGDDVLVGIRPGDLAMADGIDAPRDGRPVLEAVVEAVEHLGNEAHLLFALEGAHAVDDEGPPLLCAVVHAGTTAKPGDHVRLAVDPDAVHLFDADSGRTLRR
jgi:multiple sugar transport system ATP-binding protein